MAAPIPELPKLTPVANPLNLIPVNLKEAALDSPTFRATTIHFGEQIDAVERWLDGYMKAAGRLANEVTSIESLVNTYLTSALPTSAISEAALDHDYTVLALQRYNDGAREYWMSLIKWMKRVESTVVEPLKSFVQHDLASLKLLRRSLDLAQRNFDATIARYSAQSKSKETSALREDAFQLHEARKAYLKAAMDFCVAAPQVRAALDKILVKVFSDRWHDMKKSRDVISPSFKRWSADIDRVRGWSKEMENHERVFAQELQIARKQIEETAERRSRPSRDLDTYTIATVAPFGNSTTAMGSPKKSQPEASEKQGWLYQRTLIGKPARTVWIRRWFYVKNGVFGWLAQSVKSSAVEESEKIGVLLCGVRPAAQEDRRFCFEVKTKDSTIILQAETQSELSEWIAAFEVVKRKALENPSSTNDTFGPASQGQPFAITPPVSSEFAVKIAESQVEEGIERASTLAVDPVTTRGSMDMRRSVDRDVEASKTERVLQKLDLSRKLGSQSPSNTPAMGGIASLIAASHSALPISPNVSSPPVNNAPDYRSLFAATAPVSSLAPSTLANPPAPTTLSKSALSVGAERNMTLSDTGDGGLPSALMANLWGSTNWGYVNRLERETIDPKMLSEPAQPRSRDSSPARGRELGDAGTPVKKSIDMPRLEHVMSAPVNSTTLQTRVPEITSQTSSSNQEYPKFYPASLKTQDIQFRMLFPHAKKQDRLVMVFRATWNPSDQQEFPGRVYVTTRELYFYSNHLGLVLITGMQLSSIAEITAAPGRLCDYLFFHLKEGVTADGSTRVALKVFLEPLKLLRRRLDFLVNNEHSDDPVGLDEIMKTLVQLEITEQADDSPVLDQWVDGAEDESGHISTRHGHDVKTGLRIDGSIYADPAKRVTKNALKFRLPSHPVEYTPQGFKLPIAERQFNVTTKSLFHVLAGDKSAVFQILYCQRGATKLVQTPWAKDESAGFKRDIRYEVQHADPPAFVSDYQFVDLMNDHLCYVITERKTAWFLPRSNFFTLVLKIVITHVAKSQCKLALFARIEWTQPPLLGRGLIDHQANAFLQSYATSFVDIVTDQASRLGVQGSTSARRAVNVFGNIGEQTDVIAINASDLAPADLKGSKRMVHRSLPRLIIYAARRMAVTYSFVVMGWTLHLLKWLCGVINANRVLVAIVTISVILNLFLSGKEGWGWWTERRAGQYMRRLGIRPNVVMGRSIWLKDMNHVVANTGARQALASVPASQCHSTFTSLLDSLDPSAAASDIGQSKSMSAATQSMLGRITHSRQRFGSYRHDLLVALRLVENVEKDIVTAEWENWLTGETAQCKRVEGHIKKSNESEALKAWWDSYCTSCIAAMEDLETQA